MQRSHKSSSSFLIPVIFFILQSGNYSYFKQFISVDLKRYYIAF